MSATEKYLARAAADFERARELLRLSECDAAQVDAVAAKILLAARLEAIEDAITNGLPTAGEGL